MFLLALWGLFALILSILLDMHCCKYRNRGSMMNIDYWIASYKNPIFWLKIKQFQKKFETHVSDKTKSYFSCQRNFNTSFICASNAGVSQRADSTNVETTSWTLFSSPLWSISSSNDSSILVLTIWHTHDDNHKKLKIFHGYPVYPLCMYLL